MKRSPSNLKTAVIDDRAVFTLKPLSAIDKPTLCNQCARLAGFDGFQACGVNENQIEELKELGIFTEVTYCRKHEPIISFYPPLLGFEGDFNTFRPGGAWAKRLQEGQVIGLLDAKKESLFGKAEVISVESGNTLIMLNKHAKANHLMLDCKSDYSDKLFKVLHQIYGPRIIYAKSEVSVISLSRI